MRVRWLRSLSEDDLDAAYLLWDMSRNVNPAALPDHKTKQLTSGDEHRQGYLGPSPKAAHGNSNVQVRGTTQLSRSEASAMMTPCGPRR